MRIDPGRARRAVAFSALLTLAGSGIAAASQATSVASVSAGRSATGPARLARGPAGLTSAQAMDRAQATGRPVIVSSETTPTSQTTANPNGTYILTQSLLPTRVLRHGQWTALSARLQRSGRRLDPIATSAPLSLSGGGAGPLAVMNNSGRSLALYWPRRLPAPVVSGATATFRNVLPGVDLAVTADTQGGISDTLVIRTAAAAANPALRALKLTVRASKGLHLTADAAGNMIVTAGGKAQPAFTAEAPMMWDSAPPPAGLKTTTGPGGQILSASSGMPAYSSTAAPGAGAHIARVPLRAHGTTIIMSPAVSTLRRHRLVFPVYVDPTFHNNIGGSASSWTQVDSGFPTTSYWKESSHLQLGKCDFAGCNGLGVARDYFALPISSALAGADLDWSHIYMTDIWSASCTHETVNLYTTGSISSSTDWNHQPSRSSSPIQGMSFAYGFSSSCSAFAKDVTWTITNTVKADAGHTSTQTFGLIAGSESNDLYWKQFDSGSSNITISTEYNYTPSTPTGLAANGACGSSTTPSVIGNDDVTISAKASDRDGDNSLTTRFIVYNSDGTVAYDTSAKGTSPVTGNNATAPITLLRSVIQAFHTDGATKAYTYHVKADTEDEFSLTSGFTGYCYFSYNPLGPAPPGVTVSPTTAALGQQVTATITPPTGCSSTGSPCPTSYSYQVGAGKPTTVTVGTGTCTSTSCPVTITVTQVGPITINVAGISAGNPGDTKAVDITGTSPSTAYSDGYFSGGTYPELLTVGTGSKPSLWVSPGTGNGTLGTAVDIGSIGTGIGTPDGPGDWAGAQVLHGDFTGHLVQDVIAYYPSSGTGELIPGIGADATLQSEPTNVTEIPSVAWGDGSFANPSDVPATLVAAGNASQTGTTVTDLIGAYGDSTNGYELNLYTANPGSPASYGLLQVLSPGPGPDGTAWNNFALATAQPGGNASATVLFALDTTNGQLWESTNPNLANAPTGQDCVTNPSQSTCSIIGSTTSTWTQISAPWGSAPPTLVSADINHAGQTELWTLTGRTATAYTLSGTTLTLEATGSSVAAPTDDWPLTDAQSNCPGTTPTTATDTVTGTGATLTGNYNWACDNTFDTVLSLDGSTSYVVPPNNTVPTTDTTPSVSIWFSTSTADGVLVSLQGQALSAGSTIPGGYNPVLYVGTDGKMYAEWWPDSGAIPSLAAVDDGLWHQARITVSGGTQSFYLDGVLQGTATGTPNLAFANPNNLTIGAGYIGGNWKNEPHYQQSGNTGYRDFFNGEIADVTFTK